MNILELQNRRLVCFGNQIVKKSIADSFFNKGESLGEPPREKKIMKFLVDKFAKNFVDNFEYLRLLFWRL